jgi:hypothetical protein
MTNTMHHEDTNATDFILSIRLIRSFEHRNIRHVTLRHIEPSDQMTGKQLKEKILTGA